MKLFSQYLRDHAFWLLYGGLLSGVSFFLTFINGVPLALCVYAVGLFLLFLILFTAYSFTRYRKRHLLLQRACQESDWEKALENLPQSSLIDEDYRALLQELFKRHQNQLNLEINRLSEAQDYFTLWAHQIKLPITALSLLLQDPTPDAQACRLQLDRIHRYTDMAMAYLRLRSPETDFLFSTFELDHLIQEILHGFSTEFIHQRITLRFQETHLTVTSDRKWLGFILEQLISNALKYSAPQGLIEISCQEEFLSIRDQGCGIDPADLPRLFQPSFTGFNGREQSKASGLGLYLCHQIAQKISLPLTLDSQKGEGTCVSLDFSQSTAPIPLD